MRAAILVAVTTMVVSIPTASAATGGEQKAPPGLQQAADECFGKQQVAWDRLIDACTTVLKANVNPDVRGGALYNRGSAYVRLGPKFAAKAIADFDAALKIKPTFARGLAARGSVLIGQGKFDLAIADFTKAISLDAKSSAAFNNRGMAYMGKKDFAKATADFTKAIELAPNDPASYASRGGAYLAANDKVKAMADFDKAIALDPKQTIALYNRGMLHLSNREKEKAIADFKAVLAEIPGHALAKRELEALAKAGG